MSEVSAARGPANLDGEELIDGVTFTLYAHMVGSRTTAKGFTASNFISAFDETGWRLTEDDAFWSHPEYSGPPEVLVHHLKKFIRKVYRAMSLEPEVLILAFVLVERFMNAVGSVVRPTTVRPLILVAIGVACKTWYDEATFTVDLCDACGDRRNLCRLISAEATFVGAIRWHAVVSRKVFIKYYFALSEVVHEVNRQAMPAPILRRRDSAPHTLEIYASRRLLAGEQLPDSVPAPMVRQSRRMVGRRISCPDPASRADCGLQF
ncbi:hypothetical protein T492DRAFT_1023029 [Pavlovales sp. CCMP2436]|nr:hypothetical protein T492DRAFT_1023029 [Pavlovales sp. CCMP2436]